MIKGMSEAIKNSPYLTGAWKQGKEEGRKEGAIAELKNIQEISFKDNLNKEQTLFEILKYIGKRLKELQGELK